MRCRRARLRGCPPPSADRLWIRVADTIRLRQFPARLGARNRAGSVVGQLHGRRPIPSGLIQGKWLQRDDCPYAGASDMAQLLRIGQARDENCGDKKQSQADRRRMARGWGNGMPQRKAARAPRLRDFSLFTAPSREICGETSVRQGSNEPLSADKNQNSGGKCQHSHKDGGMATLKRPMMPMRMR